MKVCKFSRVVTAVISLDRQQVMLRYQFLVHLKNNHHLRAEHPQQASEIKNERPSFRMMKRTTRLIKKEATNLPWNHPHLLSHFNHLPIPSNRNKKKLQNQRSLQAIPRIWPRNRRSWWKRRKEGSSMVFHRLRRQRVLSKRRRRCFMMRVTRMMIASYTVTRIFN